MFKRNGEIHPGSIVVIQFIRYKDRSWQGRNDVASLCILYVIGRNALQQNYGHTYTHVHSERCFHHAKRLENYDIFLDPKTSLDCLQKFAILRC